MTTEAARQRAGAQSDSQLAMHLPPTRAQNGTSGPRGLPIREDFTTQFAESPWPIEGPISGQPTAVHRTRRGDGKLK